MSMTLSRRVFLATGALGVAGLTLGARLPAAAAAPAAGADVFAPSVFVAIGADGVVRLTVHRSEMGQGIRTALAMVLCEELDADWTAVRVERARGDARYGDQNTVGDASVVDSYEPLRKAGAAARAMLVAAAARAFAVPADQLRTENAQVIAPDGRRLSYGRLAKAAALEAVPEAPVLKSPKDFRLIGRAMPRLDLRAQTTGALTYGIDVRLPGMLHASIERCPLPRGTLRRCDDRAARAVPGVVDVFPLEAAFRAIGATSAGVVVVARDTWTCMKARKVLDVEWDLGAEAEFTSTAVRRAFEAAADKPGAVYRSAGDVDAARPEAAKTLKRRYFTPYLAHATLEPPNCAALVEKDRCEIWAPTQNPGEARAAIAAELKLPVERVTVNVTDIGGGYGRKSLHDFIYEAVRIAQRVRAPVKLTWTRADDLRCGWYKTPCLQELEAGLDASGALHYWRHHSIHSGGQASTSDPAATTLEWYELAGPTRLPYAVPNFRSEGTYVETPLRRSWMRGVQDFFHSYAQNAFFDELAVAGGHDPLHWRLELLAPDRLMQFYPTQRSTEYWFDSARLAGVIRRAGERSGWRADGVARGVAAHLQSGTYVAVVAVVSRVGADDFRLDALYCVVDCGTVVNPDGARAQVEGALLYGLSSALWGRIDLGTAGVVQSNFHDYPVVRSVDTPRIEVDFIDSTHAPTGLGEPCVPLVAPALVNAIAAAGLPRRYDLPLRSA